MFPGKAAQALGFIQTDGLVSQGLFQKADRAAQICHFLFLLLQPLFIKGKSPGKMLSQHIGGPDAELGAALGFYALTH